MFSQIADPRLTLWVLPLVKAHLVEPMLGEITLIIYSVNNDCLVMCSSLNTPLFETCPFEIPRKRLEIMLKPAVNPETGSDTMKVVYGVPDDLNIARISEDSEGETE